MPRVSTKAKPPTGELSNQDPGATTIVKSKVGYVVSDKMDKTVVVRVDTFATHPLYKKRMRKSRKFMVHDEGNTAHVGDFVRIVEFRPMSKRKSWQLGSVVRPSRSRELAKTATDIEAGVEE